MRNLLSIIIAIVCLTGVMPQAHSKPGKANKATKERLVLMPLRVPDEDKSLAGSMETALVQGLRQKYEVFSGEQVAQKAKAIFLKESKNTAKKECDETRCIQDIAEAFQAELIATANVTKRADGYFLALSIQNIFDNKVVDSNSVPCKNCDAYEVVEKLKELSGASLQAKFMGNIDEPVVAINTNNPESELWVEVQKGNSIDDYTAYLQKYPKGKYAVLAQSRLNKFKNEAAAEAAQQEKSDWGTASSTASEESFEAYLSQYPKGKYVVLAQSRLKKAKEDTATEAGRLEQQAWQKVEQAGSEISYQSYLKEYPQGRYAGLAQVRIKKIKSDQPAREEQFLWEEVQVGDSALGLQSYLDKYPSGKHAADAREKLTALRYILAEKQSRQSPVTFVDKPAVIKFSHVVAPDTPKGKAADKFKQLVEERSKGAIRVEVYPNSQLYKDREEFEALQLGAVQMLAPSMAKFGTLGVREFELFDLPFIFPNKETLYRTMDGVVGKRLFNKLETKGVTGLAFWDNGFKQMSANKSMHKVADFGGMKMRIQSSKVLDAQMKALGAMPQVMAFSEVYTALQQGVVDGTENTLSNMYTQKMHEVQKHMTLSAHGYLGYAVIVNKVFWDGLSPGQRSLLTQAMNDATVYERVIAQQESDDSLAKIRAENTTDIYKFTEAERLEWMKALLPVHKQFEDVIGKENIQDVYDIAAQVAKKKL